MASRWETLSVDGSPMRVYVSGPEGPGPRPAMVVIQHASGVDAFIEGFADRLAHEGYVGIAPDLYHREDPHASDDAGTRMGRLRDANIIKDVNTTIDFLKRQPEVRGDAIGITGFCMGGRVAYLMAVHNPELKTAVVHYGGSIMEPWGEGEPAPFEGTPNIRCAILGLFGEEDRNPSPEDVAKLDAELTKFGVVHEFHSYYGAGHAFMTEGRPSYREAAAGAAWARTIAWLRTHLRS